MSADTLEAFLATRKTKAGVAAMAHSLAQQQQSLRPLIDASFYTDKSIAFRAAWLLEYVFNQYANAYIHELPYLLNNVPAVHHASNQRHYANIVLVLTRPRASAYLKAAVKQIDMKPVVEKLFDWLIDPDVLVAVKASAAEALLYLAIRYPWIAPELEEQLRFLMRNGSAAIQARGKMILNKLADNKS